MNEVLYGREVLAQEIPMENRGILEEEDVQQASGFIKKGASIFCRRCGQRVDGKRENPCTCSEQCFYCLSCIQMGKVKRCSSFYSLPEPNAFTVVEPVLAWNGKLSEQQAAASIEIVESIQTGATHLLWAVAGAGKTEMLFEGIAYAIRQKKRICIASPRVDVCLELAPRIEAAFPTVSLAVLYGEMEDTYRYTQVVISTTHQLYRFKEAFDVLIIDEIDAFPFYLDEALAFAAKKAQKKQSTLLYLTATPDREKQQAIKEKKLKATLLPARYHGYPLPVPKGKWSENWQEKMLRSPKRTAPVKQMKRLLKEKKRFLVFVPNIHWMQEVESRLHLLFPEALFESVHSSDALRKEKVQAMRDQKLDFLITTTILERGVTFPNIDVLVIGAEDPVFTEAALVQISGRAGRSPKYPTGNVWFYHDGWSKGMRRAIHQIKTMNRLGKERGLIT